MCPLHPQLREDLGLRLTAAAPRVPLCHSKDERCCCPRRRVLITCQLLSIRALHHGQGDEKGQRGLRLTLADNHLFANVSPWQQSDCQD